MQAGIQVSVRRLILQAVLWMWSLVRVMRSTLPALQMQTAMWKHLFRRSLILQIRNLKYLLMKGCLSMHYLRASF